MLRIFNYLLDTPEKHWVIIGGYHLKKSFWGLVFLILSFLIWTITRLLLIAGVIVIIGLVLLLLSVLGHIYMHRKPYLKFWEKYKKS